MVKPESVVLIILFSALAIVVGLMSYFHAFESGLVVNMMVWIFLFIILYAALRIAFIRDQINKQEKEQEENLDFCWTNVNQMLSIMPGGRQLLWERGDGRNVSARTYTDHANRPNFFYAFVAFSEDTKAMQVIYYNATRKNIWGFVPMPEGKIWSDLFAGFKPFERTGGMGGGGFYPGQNKNGRIQLNIGGNDPQPMGNYPMPSPQYVDDAYNEMQGRNND